MNTKELFEEELETLYKAKKIALKQLEMPGILVIPDELTVWNSDTDEEPSIVGDLSDALVEQVIGDVDRCSTYAPIIIQGNAEVIKEIRLISFGDTTFLEAVQSRIEVVEARLANLDDSVIE